MKKLLILIGIIASTFVANGQTPYYPKEKTVHHLNGGIIYNSDNRFYPLITMYNAANKFHNTPLSYADGRLLSMSSMEELLSKPYSMPEGMDNKIMSLSLAVFTSEQKASLKGESIVVSLILDPIGGRVLEVEFTLDVMAGKRINMLPPDSLRALEMTLKNNNLYVSPTQFGRSLSRINKTYNVEF